MILLLFKIISYRKSGMKAHKKAILIYGRIINIIFLTTEKHFRDAGKYPCGPMGISTNVGIVRILTSISVLRRADVI